MSASAAVENKMMQEWEETEYYESFSVPRDKLLFRVAD